MSDPISRRQALAGLSALAGSLLSGCSQEQFLPPRFGELFDVSDALTMSAQRLLLMRQPLVREFREADISKAFPAINTVMPEDQGYRGLLKGGFADWR